MTISPTQYDPLDGAEIMSLIGFDPGRLTIPRIAAQVQDIIKHFTKTPDYRMKILKVMMKSGDKLDNLWTYVQLQKEKEAQLSILRPDDFEQDVAAEIVSGHITLDKKQRIRDSIKQRRENAKQKEQDDIIHRREKREEKKVQEALPTEKLDLYSSALDELDVIDNQLSKLQ